MTFEGKRVLIAGGLGAIGSSLAHRFVELGAKVTVFDCVMENTGANFANIKEIEDKIEFIRGDIRNEKEVDEAVKDKDIIFQCAGQVGHVTSMEEPFLDIDINCKGRINVLEACRKFNKDAKIIFLGSRTQIGSSEGNMDEDSQQNPADIYGANNMAAEMYHLIYNKVHGMKTTSTRLTNVYGPKSQIINPKYGVINWMIGRAIGGEELNVFGTGEQLRDVLYIDDVVDALVLIAGDERSNGEVYMLGSGKGIPFVDIVKTISRAAGNTDVKMVPWPDERKEIEVGDAVIDYNKIKKLGWEPKTSLESGIAKTVEFYKNNFDDYSVKEKKKILVTGGLGHIGSKLIREYAKRSDVELIRVLDNFLVQRYCSLFDLPENKKYEFIEGDIDNEKDLDKAMKDIDIVIHLASITDAPSTISKPEETERINFEGTKKVAHAAIKAGVKKLLFPSSTSVYGEAEGIVDETYEDLKPSSPYAETKLASEKFLQKVAEEGKIETLIPRLGTIFGTSIGMRFHTAINKFCYLAAMNKPLTVWDTALQSKRPYLGLNDAISAFMFLEEKGKSGEIYNVVTKNYSMGDIIETIKKHAPDTKIEITKSPLLNQKPYHVNDDKIRALGFDYKDDLSEAVGKTIQLFKGIKNPVEEIPKKIIYTAKPFVDESMKKAVEEVLDSGMFSSGKKLKEFEEKFAGFTGSKHAIAVANGTAAIEIALQCLGIKEGDEIIVQSNTTMPSIEPILRLGGIPRFVEVDDRSHNINTTKIRELITEKTRAIMPVHLYGNPADIKSIKDIADFHNLLLIEDCCQAHNARIDGKHVGTFGEIGCFSFYPTKNMTVLGEGGMIITDDDELAKKARMIVNHGEDERYNHVVLGGNYRLDEIHCAIGIRQLEKLEEFTKRRKEIAELYDECLKDTNLILPTKMENAEHAYHLYVIRADPDRRDMIIDGLKKEGIFLGIHYPVPCHKQKVIFDRFGFISLPVTERLSKEIISLPIYPELSDEDVKMICEKLKKLL